VSVALMTVTTEQKGAWAPDTSVKARLRTGATQFIARFHVWVGWRFAHVPLTVHSSSIRRPLTVRSRPAHGPFTVHLPSANGPLMARSLSAHGPLTFRSRSVNGPLTVRLRSPHDLGMVRANTYALPVFKMLLFAFVEHHRYRNAVHTVSIGRTRGISTDTRRLI